MLNLKKWPLIYNRASSRMELLSELMKDKTKHITHFGVQVAPLWSKGTQGAQEGNSSVVMGTPF